jgi:replicative DNA helicase
MPKIPYNFAPEVVEYAQRQAQIKTSVCGSESITKALGGGLPEASLTLVVAKSGFGKSNFLVNSCRELADIGKPSLFASVEMIDDVLIPRMAACFANVDIKTIEKAKASENPLYTEAFENIMAVVEGYPVKTFYPQTIEEIYLQAKNDKKLHGVKHLIIDHFSEIQTEKAFKDDLSKQRYIVTYIEKLYKEEGMGVIMACQFKKGIERGGDYGDRDRDEIRGPSELVTKASNVIYIYETKEQWQRNEPFRGHPDMASTCTFKLLKARQGWEGYQEEILYDRRRFRFFEKPKKPQI